MNTLIWNFPLLNDFDYRVIKGRMSLGGFVARNLTDFKKLTT